MSLFSSLHVSFANRKAGNENTHALSTNPKKGTAAQAAVRTTKQQKQQQGLWLLQQRYRKLKVLFLLERLQLTSLVFLDGAAVTSILSPLAVRVSYYVAL